MAPRQPGRPRVRLAPGTRVTMMIDGATRDGVVQLYEPENTREHDTFPVRFAHSGQWRMLTTNEVTVVPPQDAP